MRSSLLAGTGLAALAVLLLGAADPPDAAQAAAAEEAGGEEGVALVAEAATVMPIEGGVSARPRPGWRGSYPTGAVFTGVEGWVMVGLCVTPEGKVVDPVIEDSSGLKVFEQALLKDLRGASFLPATVQGEPVYQCMRLQVVYNTPGQTGARTSFLRDYRKLQGLIQAGALDEAQASLDVLAKGTVTLYEASWIRLARASLFQQRGELEKAAAQLSGCVFGKGAHLDDPKAYRVALRQLFQLQVATKQYRKALDTWADIEKLKLQPEDARIEELAGELRALVDAPRHIAFEGEIRQHRDESPAYWHHELLRRKFAFDQVEGRVERFDLRCDWKRARAPISTEVTVEVPESWGHCDLYVYGDAGTKLALIEYPAASPGTGPDGSPSAGL
ncbi:MAG: TonB family protein [Gammaproteobacteria bacterium]|nr:TonB family protein [Gammaproteobacteria bacterium]